jgi:23S rRNA pseudouridine2605 synthase
MKKPGGRRSDGKSFSGDKKSGGFKKDFSGKKPFVKKDGDSSFRKKDDDFKPRRRYQDDKPSGEKKSFGDKPYKKSYGDRDDKPVRKSYGDGEKKSFGDKPYKKSFDDRGDKPVRKSYGEKKSFGDKPYKKSFDDRGDKPFRKSFGDGEKKSFGDKPFKKRFDDRGDKPFRKSFGDGEKKSFGDKPFKKSFDDRGDKPFRKSYGDGEKKSFGDKPFKKSFDDRGDKPFRKSYGDGEKKSFGDKPYRKRSEGGEDKPFRKSYGDGEKKSFGDKPFSKNALDKKRFDDRGDKPFEKKTGEEGFVKKKTGAKEYGDGYTGFRKHEEMRKMKEELGEDWKTFESDKESKAFLESASPRPRKRKRSAETEAIVTNDNGTIRLNRFIANTGLCSRREADDLITAGVIKVNGKIVTELGSKVGPSDEIHYGDQLLRRERMVYILLNKPKDYITTTDDPQERRTVLELVANACDERIYPVGRLDRQTTGLLLLTNDGDMTSHLMHPKYGIRKIYHVTLDKNLRADDFETIQTGLELEDGFIKVDEISYVGEAKNKKEVGLVLHSGRNRIVRRIFEHLGYEVVGLDRVSYAGLTKKNLPRGRWRALSPEEIGYLKMLVGGNKKGL